MNIWRSCLLIVLTNASTVFYGMDIKNRTEHEQKLSEIDLKIRDYLFANKKINGYFDAEYYRLNRLNDYDCFINSFSDVALALPNIATPKDRLQGISCRIQTDECTVSAYAKYIIVGEDSYEIGHTVTSPVSSLACTPDCLAAGHADGSLTKIDRWTCTIVEISKYRHKKSVSSIICVPSQKLCLLGGGDEVTLMRWSDLQYKATGEAFVHLHYQVLSDRNRKKEEKKPVLTNIAAVVGPFIVMKTKDSTHWAQSPYSTEAFNAIQFGTFSNQEKVLLARIIDHQTSDHQKDKKGLGFYEEEKRIFRRLCPTIQQIVKNGWEK
jgi:WD40 repeat protein